MLMAIPLAGSAKQASAAETAEAPSLAANSGLSLRLYSCRPGEAHSQVCSEDL